MEENSIWKSCIRIKYGTTAEGWFTKDPKGSYKVGLWKSIEKEKGLLKKDCELILGDGKRIRFWEDSWCGWSPLCRVFPKLYKIVDAKGAMVADCWTETSERGA